MPLLRTLRSETLRLRPSHALLRLEIHYYFGHLQVSILVPVTVVVLPLSAANYKCLGATQIPWKESCATSEGIAEPWQ